MGQVINVQSHELRELWMNGKLWRPPASGFDLVNRIPDSVWRPYSPGGVNAPYRRKASRTVLSIRTSPHHSSCMPGSG